MPRSSRVISEANANAETQSKELEQSIDAPNSRAGFICYEIAPIDFGWSHVQTVQDLVDREVRRLLANRRGTVDELEFDRLCLPEFLHDFEIARQLALSIGFDGCLREAPRVFWMPDSDGTFQYGFILKQDNNGSTYVISRLPLPRLDRCAIDRTTQYFQENNRLECADRNSLN